MSNSKNIGEFLFDQNGLSNIFNNIKWLTISSMVFGIGFLLYGQGRYLISIVTWLISIILWAFAVTFAWSKIIMPFLKFYFEKEMNEIEVLGASIFLRKRQFWYYIGLSLSYVYVSLEWFEILVNTVKK